MENQFSEGQLVESQWGDVELCSLANGLKQLKVSHVTCNARVSLYGGHVLSWQPTGEQEVFWLSQDSLYKPEKAIRGGIPLCWPWFGGLQGEDGLNVGNHGFARQVQWQLDDVTVTETQVELILSWQGKQQHNLWPYPAKLTQKLTFSSEFTQQLTIENHSDSDVEFTGALHSYFAVNNPADVTVSKLDNVSFDCKINTLTQQTDVLPNCVGPIDRIYSSNEIMEVIDKGLGRIIRIEPLNTEQWVLWNPGQEIAQSMSDIHVGGENQFVCLEAASTNWQTVNANSERTMGQRISISELK